MAGTPTAPKQSAELLFRTGENTYEKYVAPKTREDVKRWFELFFGLKLADKACCPYHDAPLDAVCAAYFNEYSVVVIEASRGFGGKSAILAGLAVLNLLRGADVVVLGATSAQSKRVHETEISIWEHDIELDGQTIKAPLKSFLLETPTQYNTRMIFGNKLTAIMASQASVRGPHPSVLLCDEIDEMDLDLLDASLGQPMEKNGIMPQIVMSSTHQYPNGTFTEIKNRVRANDDWKLFTWCYQESHVDNGGWLSQKAIEFKKGTINERMWKIEFDMQEPSIEGRLFDSQYINLLFQEKYGNFEGRIGKYIEFEKPIDGAKYATGVDWAKEKDTTVIVTLRTDVMPVKLVAFERRQKESWVSMAGYLNKRLARYPGVAVHDGLGIGNVLKDLVSEEVIPFMAIGRRRHELYQNYLVGVEQCKIVCPMITSLYSEHKFVTFADVYEADIGHVPDGLCAMALAWSGVTGLAEGERNARGQGKILKVRHW